MSKTELRALQLGPVVPAAANSDARVSEISLLRRDGKAGAFLKSVEAPAPNETAIASARAKRAFDIAASLAALLVTAPFLAVIYCVVRLDGGPGVFVQQRIGRDGALFPCYKFRTMVPDAEQALIRLLNSDAEVKRYWLANRKLRHDPRVTRLGAFLRRRSLDELPQLVNVLLGHMSFVGPRPIVPEEKECYGDDFRYYAVTRPGLTGKWQVSGRNERTYAERVALDVDYVQGWSFSEDIRIIVATVGAVVSGRGAV